MRKIKLLFIFEAKLRGISDLIFHFGLSLANILTSEVKQLAVAWITETLIIGVLFSGALNTTVQICYNLLQLIYP